MQRYRSLFTENNKNQASSVEETRKIVNISNLVWSKTYKKRTNYYEAIDFAKTLGEGWRLPTIQELYTARKKNIKGLKEKDGYVSSTEDATDNNYYWVAQLAPRGFDEDDFGAPGVSPKNNFWHYCVKFVKDKFIKDVILSEPILKDYTPKENDYEIKEWNGEKFISDKDYRDESSLMVIESISEIKKWGNKRSTHLETKRKYKWLFYFHYELLKNS